MASRIYKPISRACKVGSRIYKPPRGLAKWVRGFTNPFRDLAKWVRDFTNPFRDPASPSRDFARRFGGVAPLSFFRKMRNNETASFVGLDMQGDVGLLAIFLAEVALDFPGQFVRCMNSHVAIHPDMDLDGDVVADMPCA